MREYKIYAGRYQLSKQLGGKEVPAVPSVYHAEILDDRSGKLARTAFLTRKTCLLYTSPSPRDTG